MSIGRSLRVQLSRVFESRTLRRIGAEKKDDIQLAADAIKNSRIIDWAEYARRSHCAELGMEPAFHYILAGERLGICRDMFDAKFYAKRYADVRHAKTNMLMHYMLIGSAEGRHYRRETVNRYTELPPVPGDRPVVIIVDHQASRTGAPILGLNLIRMLREHYYVVSFVMSDGDLLETFQAEADQVYIVPRLEVDRPDLVKRLVEHFKPLYAVLNSVETRHVATDLIQLRVPFVALVQEFTCHYSDTIVADLYKGARGLIFASDVIRDDALDVCPWLTPDKCYICPQGRSTVPSKTTREAERPSTGEGNGAVAQLKRDKLDHGKFIIIGLGTVDMRKGVDLFLSIASALKRRPSCAHVKFYWFGARTRSLSHEFAMFIEQQIERSHLEDVVFAPAASDLNAVYENADALLLCSRLDPMPNVAIDAAYAGKPVVCFDKATGFADILQADPLLSQLVAPYLDVAAASDALARLVENAELQEPIGVKMRELAAKTFRMQPYVDLIDRLGREAGAPLQT